MHHPKLAQQIPASGVDAIPRIADPPRLAEKFNHFSVGKD
jgi:hypothetical protein